MASSDCGTLRLFYIHRGLGSVHHYYSPTALVVWLTQLAALQSPHTLAGSLYEGYYRGRVGRHVFDHFGVYCGMIT